MRTIKKKPPRVIIRPQAAIFFILLILLDRSALSLLPLAAALCHELGHIIAMFFFGVPVNQIELTLFGAEIRTPPICVGKTASAAIYAAGAGANILSAALARFILPWCFEAEFFAVCSLSLAILNLLPIRTLDGGCIVEIAASQIAPAYMTVITNVISSITLFFLWLSAAYLLLLYGGNLSLMLFCLYLFVTLYLK